MECENRVYCPKMVIDDPALKEWEKNEVAKQRCFTCIGEYRARVGKGKSKDQSVTDLERLYHY
jgi:hypothetical protein